MKVGIVGCGFIGGALKKWLEENNKSVEVLISDPHKGYNDNLDSADVVFISIHTETEKDGTQDLTILKEIITNLPDKPIFIRTTLLPGTCDKLSKELGKSVYFMPEFLTERTAYNDFCNQDIVFTAEIELLKQVFVGKKFITMSSTEAEIAKYAHNVFGALKVTYFNAIKELTENLGGSYENALKGILLSGYIDEMYTKVPGPDGKLGYGGKCFPKDVNAFSEFCKNNSIGKIIGNLQELNIHFRGNDK